MKHFTPTPGGLYEEELRRFRRKAKWLHKLSEQPDRDEATRKALREAADIIESLLTHAHVANERAQLAESEASDG